VTRFFRLTHPDPSSGLDLLVGPCRRIWHDLANGSVAVVALSGNRQQNDDVCVSIGLFADRVCRASDPGTVQGPALLVPGVSGARPIRPPTLTEP